MHPADYSRHDAEYQRRRAAGYTGWNTATVAAEYLALLEQVFSAPHFPKPGRLLELGWARAISRCGRPPGRGHEVRGVDNLSGGHSMSP